MITDKQRREVAQKLRNATLYTRGTPADWWMRLHEAVKGEDDFPSPAETMSVIAKIIDRPTTTRTCKNPGSNFEKYPCDICGFSIKDKRWNYCPKCGAEIVE